MAKKIEVITSLLNAATERPSPPDQSLSYFDGMRGTQRRKISFQMANFGFFVARDLFMQWDQTAAAEAHGPSEKSNTNHPLTPKW